MERERRLRANSGNSRSRTHSDHDENLRKRRNRSPLSNRDNSSKRYRPSCGAPNSKPYPMTYTQLQRLNGTNDQSELLLKLQMDIERFVLLLEQKGNHSMEIMCLILSVLSKVSDCQTDNTRILLNRLFVKILPCKHFLKSKMTDFIAQLTQHMGTVNRNNYLKATNDLLRFVRQLQLTMPKASNGDVRVVSLLLTAQFNKINCKEDIIPKEDIDLLEMINDTLEDSVASKQAAPYEFPVEKPPNDFRTISICPTIEDILTTGRPFIRSNIVNGKYADGVDHYLDVQFRLLREDFVQPLREGIIEYSRLLESNDNYFDTHIKNIRIYQNVVITGWNLMNGDLVYNAVFDTKDFAHIRWNNSKRLLTGSLICLTFDHFKSFIVATVAGRRNADTLQKGQFQFKCQSPTNQHSILKANAVFTMAESPAFFEGYRHNLKVLQSFTSNNFPLKKHIVDVETVVSAPPYLNKDTRYDLRDLTCPLVKVPDIKIENFEEKDLRNRIPINTNNILNSLPKSKYCPTKSAPCKSIKIMNNSSWPDKDLFGLDESQFDALKAALTKQLTVIQGPPGTGKTYVGLRIVQALLCNLPIHHLSPHNSPSPKAPEQTASPRFILASEVNIPGSPAYSPTSPIYNHAVRSNYSPIASTDQLHNGISSPHTPASTPPYIPSYNPSHSPTVAMSPILIVCYTNHALDQFLEGILPFCRDIIRIGGRSKSALLEAFNMRNVAFATRDQRIVPCHIFRNIKDSDRNLKEILGVIAKIDGQLADIKNGTRILSYDELHRTINTFQKDHHRLSNHSNENTVVRWLGFREINKRQDKIDVNTFYNKDRRNRINPRRYVDEDADEDEINYIQNMRMADLDDRAPPSNHLNERSHRQGLRVEYEYIRGDRERFLSAKRVVESELKCTEAMSRKEARSIVDGWRLSYKERWRLYRCWVQEFLQSLKSEREYQQNQYFDEWEKLQALKNEEDLFTVRNAKIVGMTTTGAAKYRHIIDGIKPKIVIVEEAAEVLEAHIVTTLCEQTEHLILIGDHQQLKPNPTVFELAKKYNLETSLFERMIKNGIEYYPLSLQHRMRPEISDLLVPHIYKSLRDHPSVSLYENIRGIGSNMYFLNHNKMERSIADTMSRVNIFEAEFVVQLARYLVLQGYEESQIAILTMYSGQLFNVKKLMKGYEVLKNVRATVVDNFQGEEMDIVIISFVRSNDDGDIGFLSVSNRVNVALSRAKKGLYCIGNFDCLSKKSDLWKNILAGPRNAGKFGDSLSLFCQSHPETVTIVKNASDFSQVPEGGCLEPCRTRLPCGHVCPSMCHGDESRHETIKCTKPCYKILCEILHRCESRCHYGKDCEPCTIQVAKVLECSHTVQVKCSTKPTNDLCTAKCERVLSCSHKCAMLCGQQCQPETCEMPVEVKIACGHTVRSKCNLSKDAEKLLPLCEQPCETTLACQHKCKGTCGKCSQGRLHLMCLERCKRILVCGHECKSFCSSSCPPCTQPCENECSHSKCHRSCGYPCAPCVEPCKWRCRHLKCTKLCNEPCDRQICRRSCRYILKCGHKCIGLCGEKCPKLCRICDEDRVTEIFFGGEDEPNARFIQLDDCGHVLEVEGLLTWLQIEDMTNNNEQTSAGSSSSLVVQMKSCPKCKTVIRKTNSVNSVIIKCLNDIDQVKLKTYGERIQNEEKQLKLYDRILKSQSTLIKSPVHTKVTYLLERITNRCDPERKGLLPLHSILLLENQYEIWVALSAIDGCFDEKDNNAQTSFFKPYLVHFQRRQLNLLKFVETLKNNDQQISDVTQEIKVLKLVAEATKEQQLSLIENHSGARPIIEEAFKLAMELGPYSAVTLIQIREKINAGLLKLSGIGLPLEEKNMILKAMHFTKGHWYKCPNGHIYCIGDCGGASSEGKCPDCGSIIGGSSHRLRADNSLATEMDGATRSAWPGGA